MMNNLSMEKPVKVKPSSSVLKKRKRKVKGTVSEPKLLKLEPEPAREVPEGKEVTKNKIILKTPQPQVMCEGLVDDFGEQYPLLKNQELVKRFLSVSMSNNQKGRIRQILKDNLKGTSEILLPDVIYNRIKAVLKSSENLTDSDLRKLRILYNMLKKAAQGQKNISQKVKKVIAEKKDKLEENDSKKEKKKEVGKKKSDAKTEKTEKVIKKKGPKRYVVFLGNLPLDINKEKILNHFLEMSEQVINIRIPKRPEGKRSAIAYVELSNEPSYELALSKHHSMLGNRRINVMYTTQKDGKITKAEAKGKTAKLLALQKSGKLIGSIPLNKKRSQRRKKMKQALAKQAAAFA